jgi:hypothetical protein
MQVQAMPIGGPERTVYTGLGPIIVHDIATDGRVLIGQGTAENDLTFLGGGRLNPRSLGWYDWSFTPRLSADGRLVLFTALGTRGDQVALLRRTSGAPPQTLGEGIGWDLSADGQWALLRSGDGLLTLVSTGSGTRRQIALPGLEIGPTRFGNTSRVIAMARTSTDPGVRLYSIDLEGSTATPLSESLVQLFPGQQPSIGNYLEVSPDSRWAATSAVLGGKIVAVLHPLAGGKPVPLTGLPNAAPVGWASNNELWLERDDEADPSVIGLIRFDVRRSVMVEERTIATGGPGPAGDVHLTPDGKNVVFTQQRISGHLYVIRGLDGAR